MIHDCSENTTFMTTNTATTIEDALTPDIHELMRCVGLEKGPVPQDRFEEYQADIHHLFFTIASQYTDPSCVHLHTDELVGEAYLKFSKVLSRDYFRVCVTRKDYFARLKTVVNNHIRGLVQRHRFTAKRTGVRPPPKGQVPLSVDDFRSTKPVEISLDDPDSLLQVGEPESHAASDESDLVHEIKLRLTPLEQLVFDQVASPNAAALLLAEIDAERGRSKNNSFKVSIKKYHLADGLGMDIDQFLELEKSVRAKVSNYMSTEKDADASQAEAEASSALSLLCELFDLQIPRSTEPIIVKRALTLAARRHYDKLTDVAVQALKKVGAKIPESNGLSLTCFGVLFDKHNKICSICGHRDACKVSAATVGLDEVVPHPAVLGVKQTRIPTLVKNPDAAPSVVPSERTDSILSYLTETFSSATINEDTYFRFNENDPGDRSPQLFCVVTSVPSEHIQLRFCNPSEELKEQLEKRRNGWYLKDTATVNEAIGLIDRHSSDSMDQAS